MKPIKKVGLSKRIHRSDYIPPDENASEEEIQADIDRIVEMKPPEVRPVDEEESK